MDVNNTGISPGWRNPRERLKKHLRRTNTSRSLTGFFENASNTGFDDENQHSKSGDISTTRINPFKRRRSELRECMNVDEPIILDDSNANDPFSNEKVLLRTNKMKHSSSRPSVAVSDRSCKELFATDFSDILQCGTAPLPAVIDCYSSNKIPMDLRLGTKLRVISSKPYSWMKDSTSSGVVPVRVTGQQQHEGLQHFLNNVAADFNSPSPSDANSNSSPMALLVSACLYWQFPCFPWLATYPRADSLVNANATINQSIPTLAQPCLEALDLQWTECFDQLFLSWKKGDRRSFYMLCSSFTALFTKVNLDDNSAPGEDSLSCFQASGGRRHVAIITPSSIGFRNYLKTEGIEYEILRKKARLDKKLSPKPKLHREEDSRFGIDSSDVSQSQPPMFSCGNASLMNPQTSRGKESSHDSGNSDESPEKADLSGDHEWLENIGVSPRNTAKLKRYKSLGASCILDDENSQSKGGLDEIVGVIVKGPDVQTLYNLLQSSRICRSIAGPHANLPPTLIAAQPFVYSQMHTLKRTSQVIRRKVSEYVLELDGGPIMPHTIPMLVTFIRRSGLCNDNPATIRISDRSICNGLNEVDSELHEWNELQVYSDKVTWNKA